jgi:choline kinase
MIDVVILAAGIGSRLAPLTHDQPKCLTDLNGQPLIIRVVEQFLRHSAVSQITVIEGHLGEQIVGALSGYGPRVNTVHNDIYLTSNNLYSFTLAKSRLVEDHVLALLNGDCAYDDDVIDAVVASSAPTSEVVADCGTYMEESMKVTLGINGYINGIAKTITEADSYATSVDLYRLVPGDKEALLRKAQSIFDNAGLNTWTEVALAECFADGSITAIPLDISGKRWYEIDTLEDLSAAQQLFA